ncbi:MAG TPA: hypothetical protein DCL57_04520, partial [Microbacterium sp.]|nr:hypothetical protein [Microbacterium sp.]
LLAGQTFGLDIEELEPGRVQPLVNARVHEQHLSILTLDLHTSYQTTQRGVSDLDDFVTFHADWDLPPIDLVPPLPVADPDAADTVALHGDTD